MPILFEGLEYTPTWAGVKRGLKVLFASAVAAGLFAIAGAPVPPEYAAESAFLLACLMAAWKYWTERTAQA